MNFIRTKVEYLRFAKFVIALAFTPFLMYSCSPERKQGSSVHPQSFAYRAEFYPAFTSNSLVAINVDDSVGYIKLTVYRAHHTPEVINYSDSTALSKGDVQAFFTTLDTIPLLKMVSNNGAGNDGITVYNTVSQDGLQNEFNFWSPEKDSKEQKLMQVVLKLTRQKFTASNRQKYLDSLEHHF